MKLKEPHFNEVEYTVKPTIFGLVVMKRKSIPNDPPGVWGWGRWQRANLSDLNHCVVQLNAKEQS